MSKRVQDHKPRRGAAAEQWVKDNVAEQKKRHAAIVKEMDALERDREQWYAEFLRIVSTKGYNIDGDTRVVIAARDLPKKPKGKSRVVF